MPVDRSKYPPGWVSFSNSIRFGRADGRCECEGECGLHDGRDLIDPYQGRCRERHGDGAKWAKGRIVLTVAHMNRGDGPCRCEPLCSNPDHVKAMCQRCHNRYDSPMRQKHAAETRTRRKGGKGTDCPGGEA